MTRETPKVVVLDGYTLNPGDLSWSALEVLGPCVVHDRTAPEQVVERSAGAPILLTNKTVLSAAHLDRLPDLAYIGVLATGYNVVDVAAAARRGVVVTNVPTYGTDSVAQMVFAHLLNLCHRVEEHSRGVRQGRWSASPDFCYWDHPQIELAEQTLGIVGLGRIGRAVARRAAAFGMNVLGHDLPSVSGLPDYVRTTDLDTVFRQSDVVSLHCPLTAENRHFVNRDRLRAMKPTAFLINTSRGPLIDEPALAEALNEGRIAGAALDVLEAEPPPADHPLLAAKNCVITPHISWATRAARGRLMDTAVANIRAFLAGTPRNVVSPT